MIGRVNKQDVLIQSNYGPIFQLVAINESAAVISLAAPCAINATSITVTAGHGITTGDIVIITSGERFDQFLVTNVVGNVISLSIPAAYAFPSGSSVIAGSAAMNVNGSVTPVTFRVKPRTTKPVDISKIIIAAVHSAEADDSKFCGITALTNGVYARRVDGTQFNLGNYKSNADFICNGAAVEYSAKAGGGAYATRVYFNLIDIFTQEIRLDPRIDDELVFVVRDDLSGLTSMSVSILGSYTSGE